MNYFLICISVQNCENYANALNKSIQFINKLKIVFKWNVFLHVTLKFLCHSDHKRTSWVMICQLFWT